MYVPTSNSASHFYHEKNDSHEYGSPHSSLSGSCSSAIIFMLRREEDNVRVVSGEKMSGHSECSGNALLFYFPGGL